MTSPKGGNFPAWSGPLLAAACGSAIAGITASADARLVSLAAGGAMGAVAGSGFFDALSAHEGMPARANKNRGLLLTLLAVFIFWVPVVWPGRHLLSDTTILA
jgi:hypothetical protein